MAERITESFTSLPLEVLTPGIVIVPFAASEGIVRVEPSLSTGNEIINLNVTKDRVGNVAVSLVTGKPLQAEFLRRNPEGNEETETFIQVFDEPIDILKFFKLGLPGHPKNTWAAKAENLSVRDPLALRTFANVVADYAQQQMQADIVKRGIKDHRPI